MIKAFDLFIYSDYVYILYIVATLCIYGNMFTVAICFNLDVMNMVNKLI